MVLFLLVTRSRFTIQSVRAAEKRLAENRAMAKHLWDAPTEEFKDHLGPLAENLQALLRMKQGDLPSLRMLARTVPGTEMFLCAWRNRGYVPLLPEKQRDTQVFEAECQE